MAFVHGKDTSVLVAEFDLTSYFNSVTAARQMDVAETSVFGVGSKQYIPGMAEGNVDLNGYWDGDANAVDEELDSIISGKATVPMSVAYSNYSTKGNSAIVLQAYNTEYSVDGSTSAAVNVSAGTQSNAGLHVGGYVLAEYADRTSTGAEASVDNAASSASGLVANLHVTAFTGTSATIKVQHSANDSTWADLIDFASVTGATSEHATSSGTVNRYLRVNITAGTFSECVMAVTVARKRR